MKLHIFALSAMLMAPIHAAGVEFGSNCAGNDKNNRACEEAGGHVVSSVAILRKRSFLARNKRTFFACHPVPSSDTQHPDAMSEALHGSREGWAGRLLDDLALR